MSIMLAVSRNPYTVNDNSKFITIDIGEIAYHQICFADVT